MRRLEVWDESMQSVKRLRSKLSAYGATLPQDRLRPLRLAALFSLILTTAAQAADRPLTFAPLPMEKPETVIQQVRPMLSYLETVLGREIAVVYARDYGDLLTRFRKGEVDLAYLGPLPYLSLRSKYPQAEPLVHFREPSGAATYSCAVIAWNDTVTSLSGLTGKRIALTQPLSTCGYFSTSALLRAAGSDIEANRYSYTGAHDTVALTVVRGEFDLGGLKTAIARKYSVLGLRILAESAPLPGFALIANGATLAEADKQAIRDALSALEANGKGAERMTDWGPNLRNGAVEARDSDYDGMRTMGGWDNLPEKGNQ